MKRRETQGDDGPRVAVCTLDPSVYYTVTQLLKSRGAGFVASTPGQPIPLYVTAVITTVRETHLIRHDRKIVCTHGSENAAVEKALKTIRNVEAYKSLTIGIDPGETFGLAVIGDGHLLHTASHWSAEDLVAEVRRWCDESPQATITIKLGGNEREHYTSTIMHALKQQLTHELGGRMRLLLVDEQFTTATARRRRVKRRKLNEASALEIALR